MSVFVDPEDVEWFDIEDDGKQKVTEESDLPELDEDLVDLEDLFWEDEID